MRKTSPTLPSRPLSHVTLITDKYPPHVAGGAELSIHTTVSHIVPSVQVHVINIDHDDTHRRERPHHATLHPLPLSQDVPALGALDSRFHIVPAVWLKRFKRWFGGRAVYGLVAGYSFYARYIFTATAVSRWHKTKLMYLNFFCYLFDSKNLEQNSECIPCSLLQDQILPVGRSVKMLRLLRNCCGVNERTPNNQNILRQNGRKSAYSLLSKIACGTTGKRTPRRWKA